MLRISILPPYPENMTDNRISEFEIFQLVDSFGGLFAAQGNQVSKFSIANKKEGGKFVQKSFFILLLSVKRITTLNKIKFRQILLKTEKKTL